MGINFRVEIFFEEEFGDEPNGKPIKLTDKVAEFDLSNCRVWRKHFIQNDEECCGSIRKTAAEFYTIIHSVIIEKITEHDLDKGPLLLTSCRQYVGSLAAQNDEFPDDRRYYCVVHWA